MDRLPCSPCLELMRRRSMAVKSPDNRIEVIFTDGGSTPQYAVRVDGRELLLPSALELLPANGSPTA